MNLLSCGKKKAEIPLVLWFGWLVKLPAARLGFKGHIFANQCLHHYSEWREEEVGAPWED